jgi:SAM-dependent methyltransferase
MRLHYEVERDLADRIRRSQSRSERATMYASLYDELFARVPDHPQLTRRLAPEHIAFRNAMRMRIVGPLLARDHRVLEIGAGDCTFSYELCRRVGQVCGLEITAQVASLENAPSNFGLALYDGFDIPFRGGTFDIAFSDQLVEHLHPDDVADHFREVRRVLARGGCYVFRTPHRFTGPHDISRRFTNGVAQGFHIKEWTYRELRDVLRACGYHHIAAVWFARGRRARMPLTLAIALERGLGPVPPRLRRVIARAPFPSLVVVARSA